MRKYLEIVAVIFVLIGGTFGAFTVFATNSDLQLVSQRLDKKILVDRMHAIQERIWAYEDRFGPACEKCDPTAKDVYRRLKQEMKDIERELNQKS